jgi:hypothetical protein
MKLPVAGGAQRHEVAVVVRAAVRCVADVMDAQQIR